MNVCEQLFHEVSNADSIKALAEVSDKANIIFMTDDNLEDRLIMTDDFWVEFTKAIRKRFMQLQ